MLLNDLLTSPERFHSYFNQHPDGLLIVDFRNRIQHVNAAALALTGYAREALLQVSVDQFLDSSGHARHLHGHMVDTKITNVPLRIGDRKVGELITMKKMTPRQIKRDGIADVQEIFTFMLERSPYIISSFSPDGVFTYVSPTVTALLGYSPEEVVGRHSAAFNHPDEILSLVEYRSLSSIERDTAKFVGRVRLKNGDYRWYETTSEYIRNECGDVIQTISVGRDITRTGTMPLGN